jgi:hypothetical protein
MKSSESQQNIVGEMMTKLSKNFFQHNLKNSKYILNMRKRKSNYYFYKIKKQNQIQLSFSSKKKTIKSSDKKENFNNKPLTLSFWTSNNSPEEPLHEVQSKFMNEVPLNFLTKTRFYKTCGETLYSPYIADSQLFFYLPLRNSLYFNSIDDVLKKYDYNKVTNISSIRIHNFVKNKSNENSIQIVPTYSPNLQSPVWVKWQKKFETGTDREQPIEIRINCFGNRQDIFSKYLYLYDKNNIKKNQFIRTTPGKIIFNLIIKKSSI